MNAICKAMAADRIVGPKTVRGVEEVEACGNVGRHGCPCALQGEL